jgi:hypothetical protein
MTNIGINYDDRSFIYISPVEIFERLLSKVSPVL